MPLRVCADATCVRITVYRRLLTRGATSSAASLRNPFSGKGALYRRLQSASEQHNRREQKKNHWISDKGWLPRPPWNNMDLWAARR
jgi:hypothetical protein